jgi:hypothetical protein
MNGAVYVALSDDKQKHPFSHQRDMSAACCSFARLVLCCVEAECHFCYLRDSGIYVHESCCLGTQRHPLPMWDVQGSGMVP